ncbi:MAG: hypothetical protein ACFFEK_15745 [Candidatus Thorarchaeota archaeon]
MEFHRYVMNQIAIAIASFTLVICFAFLLFRLPVIRWGASPLSIFAYFNGHGVDQDLVDYMCTQYGLVPEPDVFEWIYMFGKFIACSFVGKFGISFLTLRPVSSDLAVRLPNTLLLMLSSLIISTIYLTINEDSRMNEKRKLTNHFSSTIPVFWIACILLLLGGHMIPDCIGVGFPEFGTISYDIWNFAFVQPWGCFLVFFDVIYHLVLPVVTLVLVTVTSENSLGMMFSRAIKSSEIYEIPRSNILVESGKLLSATLLIEVVFTWRGIGRWFFDSLMLSDYPAIQGIFISMAVIIIGMSFFSGISLNYRNLTSDKYATNEQSVVDQELMKTRLRMFLLYQKKEEGVRPPQVVRRGDPFLNWT